MLLLVMLSCMSMNEFLIVTLCVYVLGLVVVAVAAVRSFGISGTILGTSTGMVLAASMASSTA